MSEPAKVFIAIMIMIIVVFSFIGIVEGFNIATRANVKIACYEAAKTNHNLRCE